MNQIPVLDKGYVRLTRIMAEIGEDGLEPVSDLAPTNDARVSFARQSQEFSEADARLVSFLGREQHTSPFRGAVMQFEVKAPLFVCRQWWKYVIGSDHEAYRDPFCQWNEVSRRYVADDPEFYIPTEWRSAPENRKQGSGQVLSDGVQVWLDSEMLHTVAAGAQRYRAAIDMGCCAEQARLFLPAYAMYTQWRWTASLQAVCHFLNQRLAHDAQAEMREYGRAVHALIEPRFPVSVKALGVTK